MPLEPAERPAGVPRDRGGGRDETREEVLALYDRHVSAGQARLARLMNLPVEERSAGCRVHDTEGNAYLDAGGYGVFLVGHGHPRVVAAVREQLERHPLATRMLPYRELPRAAARLAAVTPDGLDRVFFTGSGAEAVEVALKLARLQGKRRLIAAHRGFHGKTLGALSVTGRPAFQDPFRPLLPDTEHVPFGDPEALRRALTMAPGEACVILEPVQAEGGVRIPPPGYLAAARALTREHGALLVLDEIQSGLGRLGHWWGADEEAVVPDVLLVGKSLSGGVVPVGAAVATEEVFAPLSTDPYLHTSTFGGSPLAMAAVTAVLEVIRDEDLVTKARTLGAHLLEEIRRAVASIFPDRVTDVRGRGLLLGIEMATPGLAAELILALVRQRVIVCHSSSAHRVVRLTPPATLEAIDCAWLVAAIAAAAESLKTRPLTPDRTKR